MWRTLAAIGDEMPTTSGSSWSGRGQSFSAGLDRAMLDPARAGDGEESVAGLLGAATRRSPRRSTATSAGSPGCATRGSSRSRSVQGHAIGAGFQLALSCDLRVVADDAQFCMKEPALGLVPDLTGTKPLVESVGYARALEICATARLVGAAEALEIGLATVVYPVAELDGALADLVAALTPPIRAPYARPRRCCWRRRTGRWTSSGGTSVRPRSGGSASWPDDGRELTARWTTGGRGTMSMHRAVGVAHHAPRPLRRREQDRAGHAAPRRPRSPGPTGG